MTSIAHQVQQEAERTASGGATRPRRPDFDVRSVRIPGHRDRRRWLRRFLNPRWRFMLSHRQEPISPLVGVDRGTPIDRVFIEAFLDHHRALVRGRVLEIKDREYTQRFGVDTASGGNHVTRSDILDRNTENKDANIHDDITSLSSIADDSYDCFIVTQVLQYVADLDAAIAAIRRVLAPGGSVFITVPTLGKLDGQEDNVAGHFWRLTADSARHIMEKRFPADHVEVQAWGNLRLAMGFLSGLCAQDMTPREFAKFDARFTCGVLIRATKPSA